MPIPCSVWIRSIATIALCCIAGLSAAQQGSQTYPGKPIRLILPYAPGGSTSIIGRIIGQKLTEAWGQQVLVDNRPGGNTIIGSEALVKAAPDGYTILMVSIAHVINPSLFPTPYDAFKDFAPVATLCSTEQILVINPGVPANDLREFIAYARARPGQLNYASSSAGSPTHLASALLENTAGLKMQHVAYKGGAQALSDLVGGQVQLYFSPPLPAMPLIKAGKLKALAISGDSRWSGLPQVPTFNEAGLQGIDVRTWFGILAPAATPGPIIGKLSGEFARMLALPELKETLAAQGLDPLISTPEQFAAMMRADGARFARVIKAGNIKVEQ
jgi:tripartite-type tricarboxylate transporter receptor subunit TctC